MHRGRRARLRHRVESLKLVGAADLVWLGIQALRSAGAHAGVRADAQAGARELQALRGFRQGLISNLANPKIAVLFTSLLPQFIDGGHRVLLPFLLLDGLFVAMTVAWLSGYALMAAKAGGLLTRPRVKLALDRSTGIVLVALGSGSPASHAEPGFESLPHPFG